MLTYEITARFAYHGEDYTEIRFYANEEERYSFRGIDCAIERAFNENGCYIDIAVLSLSDSGGFYETTFISEPVDFGFGSAFFGIFHGGCQIENSDGYLLHEEDPAYLFIRDLLAEHRKFRELSGIDS